MPLGVTDSQGNWSGRASLGAAAAQAWLCTISARPKKGHFLRLALGDTQVPCGVTRPSNTTTSAQLGNTRMHGGQLRGVPDGSTTGAFPMGRQLIALHSSMCIVALDRDSRKTTEHAANPPRMSSAVSPATNQARCSHGVRRAWYKTSRVHDWLTGSTCSGQLGQLRQPTVAQVLQRLWHPASATRPLSACATAMGGPWRWEAHWAHSTSRGMRRGHPASLPHPSCEAGCRQHVCGQTGPHLEATPARGAESAG